MDIKSLIQSWIHKKYELSTAWQAPGQMPNLEPGMESGKWRDGDMGEKFPGRENIMFRRRTWGCLRI